jgi:mRNA interferase YafQ
MKYTIKWTSRFKKEYKLLMKRCEDIQALDNVIRLLADGVKLPPECRDHVLSGRYAGLHECHVRPDLLLVYDIDEGVLVLTLFRTGSHSDLF